MNAISMVHKMQRLAMNVSEGSDTSSLLAGAAGVPNRQKCATIVEEAEIDDCDGDDHRGQDNNGYGAEGRKTNSVRVRVSVLYPATFQYHNPCCVLNHPASFLECMF